MTVRLVKSVAKCIDGVLFEASPRLIDRAMRSTPRASIQRLISAHGVSPRFLRVLTLPYVLHPIVRGVLANESDELLNRRARELDGSRRRRYASASARLDRYAAIKALIDSIDRVGFRPPDVVDDNPDAIGVIVREEGGLTWLRQGDHRLSLSKALDLPSCIVRVRAFEPGFVDRALRDHAHVGAHRSVLYALEAIGVRRVGGG